MKIDRQSDTSQIAQDSLNESKQKNQGAQQALAGVAQSVASSGTQLAGAGGGGTPKPSTTASATTGS